MGWEDLGGGGDGDAVGGHWPVEDAPGYSGSPAGGVQRVAGRGTSTRWRWGGSGDGHKNKMKGCSLDPSLPLPSGHFLSGSPAGEQARGGRGVGAVTDTGIK